MKIGPLELPGNTVSDVDQFSSAQPEAKWKASFTLYVATSGVDEKLQKPTEYWALHSLFFKRLQVSLHMRLEAY